MIDLECPKCGRVGSVPQTKVNTRLICKKCLAVFHMGPTGRAILGEPVSARDPHHGHGVATAVKKADASAPALKLGELNYGLVGVLGVLLLIGTVYLFVAGPWAGSSPNLFPVAQEMAAALEKSDANAVQNLSASDGSNEAATWFKAAQGKVEELKKGPGLKVTAIVTSENSLAGTAQVDIFLIPIKAQARNEQIAREAGVSSKTAELITFWTYSRGRWRFDAKKTLEVSPVGAG